VLGLVLMLGLPTLWAAAFYVALLAAVAASVSLGAGFALWRHDSLVARSGAVLAAAAILLGELLTVSLGLPGASELAQLAAPVEVHALVALGLSAGVLVCLLSDGFRRPPEPGPDNPYAL
jgi:hypothetical protein